MSTSSTRPLGTLVSSTALPSDASVADGVAVLLTLLLLQVTVAAARQRSVRLRRVLDFAPQPLVREGMPDLRRSPTTAQLTRGELESMLRRQGVIDLGQVQLAVLEPTGIISVLRLGEDAPVSLFHGLERRDGVPPTR